MDSKFSTVICIRKNAKLNQAYMEKCVRWIAKVQNGVGRWGFSIQVIGKWSVLTTLLAWLHPIWMHLDEGAASISRSGRPTLSVVVVDVTGGTMRLTKNKLQQTKINCQSHQASDWVKVIWRGEWKWGNSPTAHCFKAGTWPPERYQSVVGLYLDSVGCFSRLSLHSSQPRHSEGCKNTEIKHVILCSGYMDLKLNKHQAVMCLSDKHK